ncbi:MAG: membrane dipeptidase [Clostridia bacterium]|nr:membrane dipeptidase [Clostridia bacterium]
MNINLTDSHTDLVTALSAKLQKKFIHNLSTNVQAINCAVFTTDNSLCVKDIKKHKQQIQKLQKLTKTKLLFSVEDIGSISAKEIDKLIKLKPFCVSLTWNFKNQYAGGAKSKGKITKLGKTTIKKLESNNVIIDTAHLNKKSFWKFVKITNKPILNTHSNINALHKNARNLTDKQIKTICDSNGFLGITIFDEFVKGGPINTYDIALQLDYLIKKFGHQNFGFGTDLFGIHRLPTDLKTYDDFYKIANHLQNMGHSYETINCIFNKNFKNFLNRLYYE